MLTSEQINFLLRLYFAETKVKPIGRKTAGFYKNISEYINVEKYKNPDKTFVKKVGLNSMGRTKAENILREKGYNLGPNAGIALEKREWVNFKNHTFSSSEIISALKLIAKNGHTKIDIYDDWSGNATRVVMHDLDSAIDKVCIDVDWTRDKGKGYFEELGFSDCFVWIFCDFLDKLRSEIRNIAHQQEFIIWDNS